MYIGLNLYSNIATQGSLSLYPFSLFRELFHFFPYIGSIGLPEANHRMFLVLQLLPFAKL
jgi:hypothetical protein